MAADFRPFNVQVETRHGPLLVNRNDRYIGRSLQRYGEWSPLEMHLLDALIQPGQTVVELGANIGSHTVPLAKRIGPSGWVIAVEPQRLVFQTLCANIALQSLANVETLRIAVGDQAGELLVPTLDPTRDNNFGGLELGEHRSGEVVPVRTIDSLNLTACHAIKADVEGMEEVALRGAIETITRWRPLLYVESDREDSRRSLLSFIESLDYDLYQHWVPLFMPENFRRNPENLFPGIVSKNFLALPRSVPAEVDLPRVRAADFG